MLISVATGRRLADGDRAVALPRLGDELTQVRLSRSQRIGHAWTVTPCSSHCGAETHERTSYAAGRLPVDGHPAA
jgi:hypothetical protein